MDHALVYVAPHDVRIEPVDEMPDPRTGGTVRIRTLWSGISRGTERLVFEGRVPVSEYDRMRAPFQQGRFPFPVIYGYAAVGVVTHGPQDIVKKTVFTLAPHRTGMTLSMESVLPLPEGLPPRRAVLAANMETALNVLWDSSAGPGDRIAIVGGGILGGLIAGLCGAMPGADVTLVDVDSHRKELSDHMNVSYRHPDNAPAGCDIVIHTSSSASGLSTALDCCGDEATLVEASWFGDVSPTVPLGGAFHSRRLRIVSSQVGQVATSRRARWTHRRRLAKALELLCDPKYDHLITEDVVFADLPDNLPRILGPGAPGLATVVRYP